MSIMPDFERDLVAVGDGGWHSRGARLRRAARRGAPGAGVVALLVAIIVVVSSIADSTDRETPATRQPTAVDRLLSELAPTARPALLSKEEQRLYSRRDQKLGLDPARAVTVPAPDGASADRWLVIPGERGLCTIEGTLGSYTGASGTCGPYRLFLEGGRIGTFSSGDGTITWSAVVADGFRRIVAIEKRTGEVRASAPIVDNAGQLRLREDPALLRRYRIVVQREAPATLGREESVTGLTGGPARFYALPRSWRQTDSGPAAIKPGGSTSTTTLTSWPYELDANGPANALPRDGILIDVLLRRPGCRPVKQSRGYPELGNRFSLRIPATTTFSLEGAPDVPQYRINRRAAAAGYYVEIRVSINNPDPGPALLERAQKRLEHLAFMVWPNRC